MQLAPFPLEYCRRGGRCVQAHPRPVDLPVQRQPGEREDDCRGSLEPARYGAPAATRGDRTEAALFELKANPCRHIVRHRVRLEARRQRDSSTDALELVATVAA